MLFRGLCFWGLYIQLPCRLDGGVDLFKLPRSMRFWGLLFGPLCRSEGGNDSFVLLCIVWLRGLMSDHFAVQAMVLIRSMLSLTASLASGGVSA